MWQVGSVEDGTFLVGCLMMKREVELAPGQACEARGAPLWLRGHVLLVCG